MIGAVMLLLPVLSLQSCFTGIESTKKITLSREDKKLSAPTPEEMLLADVKASPNTDWSVGKLFVVTGERATALFEPRSIKSNDYTLHNGDTLSYVGSRVVKQPDGNDVVKLQFSRNDDEFSYVPQQSSRRVMSDALPGVVDLAMVKEVEKILKGRDLWTRSSLWSDMAGAKSDGRKYEKVSVLRVDPGNEVFPLRVVFKDEEGMTNANFINFGNAGNNSRSFANMFTLTDPRENHKDISAANWEKIRRGEVAEGMTKEECRLSRGNPTEVNTGHDYSHALLIWGYPEGTVLYFVDGILKGINTPPKIY